MTNKAKLLRLLKYFQKTEVVVVYKPTGFSFPVEVSYNAINDTISSPLFSFRLQEEFFKEAIFKINREAAEEGEQY